MILLRIAELYGDARGLTALVQEQDILGHCRQPGGPVQGCWVVDSVLGRS